MTVDWDKNVYYHPEAHNAEIFAEIEMSPEYDFHKVVVWRHKERYDYRWGEDSGCSCPSPFEDTQGFDQLEKLPGTLEDLRKAVYGLRSYADEAIARGEDPKEACYRSEDMPSVTDCQDFMRKVEDALKIKY